MMRDRDTYWPGPTWRPREHWLLRLAEIAQAAPEPRTLVIPAWPVTAKLTKP